MPRVLSHLRELTRGTPDLGHEVHYGPDGDTTVAGPHINLRAWGGSKAVDGSADWTEEIDDACAAAVSRGHRLFSPPGIYVYDGTLTIPHRVFLVGPGCHFDEGFDKDSPLRATIKLADGANVDFVVNDPDGPERGGQDTVHTWQRTLIQGITFDCNGAAQTGTRHGLHFYRAWGINLLNVMVLSARGINIYLEDVNEVNGLDVTAIDPDQVTTTQVYFKDSADSEWHGLQAHGAKGPLLVFDNTTFCKVDARIGYTIDAATNDEYLLSLINASHHNEVAVVADKPFLDGLYMGSTVVANKVSFTGSEVGYQNASARSAARIACSNNAITIVSRPDGNPLENDVSGVVIEANADNNNFSGSSVSGYTTNWDVSLTGTENNILPFPTQRLTFSPSQLTPVIGSPALGTIGGVNVRPALMFDGAASETAAVWFRMPINWILVRPAVIWTATTAAVANVRWVFGLTGFATGEVVSGADAGAVAVVSATTGDDDIVESVSAVNFPVTPGEWYCLRVTRTGDHGDDTYDGIDAALVLATLRWVG